MEATFIAVMFFGWGKVSKRFHLHSYSYQSYIRSTLIQAFHGSQLHRLCLCNLITGHEEDAQVAYKVLQENIPYFGYGYIKDVNQLVPNVPLNFYAFRVMVILGGYFILFFIVVLFFVYKKDLSKMRWMHCVIPGT